MAGIGFLGHTITFAGTAITHLTNLNLNVQGGAVTQIVADNAAPLSISQPAVKSVTFSFAVPASGGATLLEAVENGDVGALAIVLKDGIGGSTLATWTASDSLSESQGASVGASGGAFVIATCTINTNGGSWA